MTPRVAAFQLVCLTLDRYSPVPDSFMRQVWLFRALRDYTPPAEWKAAMHPVPDVVSSEILNVPAHILGLR